MVKRLEDNPNNENEILCAATVIQRCMFVEPSLVARSGSGQERDAADGFVVRINDSVSGSGTAEVRKIVEADIVFQGEPTGFSSVSVTSSVELPMKKIVIFDRQPFRITACELMLELTSFTGKINLKTGHEFEFRPDLMCHMEDIRNLVSIRDWQDGLDSMREYDMINTSPTVEYIFDAKYAKDGSPQTIYVPRFRMTFYMTKDWLQPFLANLMPIIFICLGNLLNGAYSLEHAFKGSGHNYMTEEEDEDGPAERKSDFLSDELTLGLTLVFMIPQISQSESLDNAMDLNHFFVAILFIGLILGSIGGVTHNYVFWLSNLIMWGALTIPMNNFMAYCRLSASLRAASPHVAAPYSECCLSHRLLRRFARGLECCPPPPPPPRARNDVFSVQRTPGQVWEELEGLAGRHRVGLPVLDPGQD